MSLDGETSSLKWRWGGDAFEGRGGRGGEPFRGGSEGEELGRGFAIGLGVEGGLEVGEPDVEDLTETEAGQKRRATGGGAS